jgi:hypothetical protein
MIGQLIFEDRAGTDLSHVAPEPTKPLQLLGLSAVPISGQAAGFCLIMTNNLAREIFSLRKGRSQKNQKTVASPI